MSDLEKWLAATAAARKAACAAEKRSLARAAKQAARAEAFMAELKKRIAGRKETKE
jgi:hypothetical protein